MSLVQLQTKTIFQPNGIPVATGTEENLKMYA